MVRNIYYLNWLRMLWEGTRECEAYVLNHFTLPQQVAICRAADRLEKRGYTVWRVQEGTNAIIAVEPLPKEKRSKRRPSWRVR